MLIRLEDPDCLPELARFLRRAGCSVEPRGAGRLEVTVGDAPDERQAMLEVDLYLRAWAALARGGKATIVE